MTADGYAEKIKVRRLSRMFDFVNEFFSQKIQYKILSLEIQLILSILGLWHLKSNTKDGIMWAWSKLRPKLQELALNKGHFEKVVLT